MTESRLRKAAQEFIEWYDAEDPRPGRQWLEALRAALEAEPEPHHPEEGDCIFAGLAGPCIVCGRRAGEPFRKPEPGGEPDPGVAVAWINTQGGVMRADGFAPYTSPGSEWKPLYLAPPDTVPREVAERMAGVLRGCDCSAGVDEALAAYREVTK